LRKDRGVGVPVILGVLLGFGAMAEVLHLSEEVNQIIPELLEQEGLELAIKLVSVDLGIRW